MGSSLSFPFAENRSWLWLLLVLFLFSICTNAGLPTECKTDADCNITGQDEWEKCELKQPVQRTSVALGNTALADGMGAFQDWNDCRCLDKQCKWIKNIDERQASLDRARAVFFSRYPWCSQQQISQENVWRLQKKGVLSQENAFMTCKRPGISVSCTLSFKKTGKSAPEIVMYCPAAEEGNACLVKEDCQHLNCKKYDGPIKSGYYPDCIASAAHEMAKECKCMCFQCK